MPIINEEPAGERERPQLSASEKSWTLVVFTDRPERFQGRTGPSQWQVIDARAPYYAHAMLNDLVGLARLRSRVGSRPANCLRYRVVLDSGREDALWVNAVQALEQCARPEIGVAIGDSAPTEEA